MNILKGTISEIQSYEDISLIKVIANSTVFTSIVLDTPKTVSYLKKDHIVQLIFKETEVIISKDFHPNISLQNQFLCQVQHINKGILLTEISLTFGKNTIKSIITTNACKQLQLNINDTILALIKTNEISLSNHD